MVHSNADCVRVTQHAEGGLEKSGVPGVRVSVYRFGRSFVIFKNEILFLVTDARHLARVLWQLLRQRTHDARTHNILCVTHSRNTRKLKNVIKHYRRYGRRRRPTGNGLYDDDYNILRAAALAGGRTGQGICFLRSHDYNNIPPHRLY